MKSKTIQLVPIPELALIDKIWAFSATITTSTLSVWCLSLTLLKENLINSVIIADSNFRPIFELFYNAKNERMISVVSSGNKIDIKLGHAAFDFVMHFYLAYFRDGQAAVNHIDLETTYEGKDMCLTFYAERAKTPLTPLEAETLLRSSSTLL